MNTDLTSNFLFLKLTALLIFALAITGCGGSCSCGSEWEIEYTPGTSDYYAAVHVLSNKTGDYHQLYANEGKWKTNPNVPSPKSSITGGNIKMQYMPQSGNVLPSLNLYSGNTGEWEQFYLKGNKWLKNTNFTSPKIGVTKSDLHMEFIPGSANALAGMVVTSGSSKEMEIFYYQDNQWKLNTNFPAAKLLN